MSDPIAQMNELKANSKSLTDSTLNLIAQNQEYNTSNEILVKQDQLNKIKNDRLNKQLENLNELEHNIINKDRLIEQTNQVNENNDKNIYTLYVGLSLSFILFLGIILHSLGKLNDKLLTVLVAVILFIFILIVMYTYNIAHFADLVHFIDNRRNLRLQESIGNFGSRIQKWRQERVYGNEQDWIDANCECTEPESTVIDEENIGVDIKPGYFYYDKNAPKQNITPDGGKPINISDDPKRKIYDKIKWVNHDNVSGEDDREYNIFPNKDRTYKNGDLVANSTYTINL